MKLKKGDKVLVIAGKDKGRRGKIERIFPKEGKVLISGINLYKRHLKRRDEKHPGGIVEIPRPLFISKVALVCPKCDQPTRIGYKIVNKEKLRICKKCKEEIDL